MAYQAAVSRSLRLPSVVSMLVECREQNANIKTALDIKTALGQCLSIIHLINGLNCFDHFSNVTL